MNVRTATFTIEYTVDLDGVPGWGNVVSDWVTLAKREILAQTHYNTTAVQVGETEYGRICHSHHDICEGRL